MAWTIRRAESHRLSARYRQTARRHVDAVGGGVDRDADVVALGGDGRQHGVGRAVDDGDAWCILGPDVDALGRRVRALMKVVLFSPRGIVASTGFGSATRCRRTSQTRLARKDGYWHRSPAQERQRASCLARLATVMGDDKGRWRADLTLR